MAEVKKAIPKEENLRVGVFICHCGKNIGGVVDVPSVVEFAKTLPDVVHTDDNMYSCAEPGQESIKKAIKEHNINRVVVAACSPSLHQPTFRKCVEHAGLNKYLFEMANIREHCSWVHMWEKEAATEKAKDLVAMAVAKARMLEPIDDLVVPVTKRSLVIGGGVAGCQAALDLADMGFDVVLMEKSGSIGGRMAQLDKTFPTMDCSICTPGDEEVILADGNILPIEHLVNDILEKKNFNPHPPITYSFENDQFKSNNIVAGQKLPSPQKLIQVETGTGMRVKFTPDHRIMVDAPEGPVWIKCSELKVGDRLYAPRKIKIGETVDLWLLDLLPGDLKVAERSLNMTIRRSLKNKFGSLRKAASKLGINYKNLLGNGRLSVAEIKKVCKSLGLSWEKVKSEINRITYKGVIHTVQLGSQILDEEAMYLLGLLASDGCIRKGRTRFFNMNTKLVELFIEGYRRLFPTRRCCIYRRKSGGQEVQVKNKLLFHLSDMLGIKESLKPVFRLRENLIAAFLRGFFDGDGTVKLIKHKNWASAKIAFCLGKDYNYAFRLHLLLKRLGIVSKVYEYEKRVIIDISERDDVIKFIRKVGSRHPKKIHRFREIEEFNVDSKHREGFFKYMPLKCGKLLAQLRERYGIPLRVFHLSRSNTRRILKQECRASKINLGRMLRAIEKIVDPYDEDLIKLREIYNSDFFLDSIKELNQVSSNEEYVYDITVEGTHSFIPKGAFVVSNCILGPKLVDVGAHPKITLLSDVDIKEVGGFIGNFRVKAVQKPRLIDHEKCNGCGECVDVCPVILPRQFDENLKPRKAIYLPFAQSVPSFYVIDEEHCIKCHLCASKCARGAIDFGQKEKKINLKVGTIVVATGCKVFDATKKKEYGYGRYENVVSSMDFERIVCASGPTDGLLLRPDKKHAKRFAFVQCVGSRDKKIGKEYCSATCCMNSIKLSLLIKEHDPDAEVFIFGMDIRAYGKGFEELYSRARDMGVIFIRGRPSEIREGKDKNPIIISENLLNGQLMETEVDMAILAVGMEPVESAEEVAKVLHIPRDSDGFYMEAHPKLKPVDSPCSGIFLAGSGKGPKNIEESVASASAAASRAAIPMSQGKVTIEGITPVVDEEKCKGCGICVKVCPYGAITVEKIGKTPAKVIAAKCHGCGTCVAECPTEALEQRHFKDQQIMNQIDAALAKDPKNKILAFCCNWCSYAGSDLAGVSRFQYPTNVRIIKVMCSGRVKEKFILRAFEKGAGMVWVTGCHLPNDCHYIKGNVYCKKRIERLQKTLESKIGVPSERLKLDWISAAEGIIFANLVKKYAEELRKINEGR